MKKKNTSKQKHILSSKKEINDRPVVMQRRMIVLSWGFDKSPSDFEAQTPLETEESIRHF